jgi:hypothetical protein
MSATYMSDLVVLCAALCHVHPHFIRLLLALLCSCSCSLLRSHFVIVLRIDPLSYLLPLSLN